MGWMDGWMDRWMDGWVRGGSMHGRHGKGWDDVMKWLGWGWDAHCLLHSECCLNWLKFRK
eukprot:497735-Karenia_brevis.AAC.1